VAFFPNNRQHMLEYCIDTHLKALIMEKREEYEYNVIELKVMPDLVRPIPDINTKSGMISPSCSTE